MEGQYMFSVSPYLMVPLVTSLCSVTISFAWREKTVKQVEFAAIPLCPLQLPFLVLVKPQLRSPGFRMEKTNCSIPWGSQDISTVYPISTAKARMLLSKLQETSMTLMYPPYWPFRDNLPCFHGFLLLCMDFFYSSTLHSGLKPPQTFRSVSKINQSQEV